MKWRPTTFADMHDPRCVQREWKNIGGYRSEIGRSSFRLRCPFCSRELRVAVWSISGGGKRCECGAIFGSGGSAYKLYPFRLRPIIAKTIVVG